MKLKKILASILCVAMVLSTMSTVAFAENDNYVAYYNLSKTHFTSLSEAFANNTENETIILENDCEETVVVENANCSLYLNGYTLTGSLEIKSGTFYLHGNGKEGEPEGKIVNTGIDGKYPLICGNAQCNISEGTLEATDSDGVAVYVYGSKANLMGDGIVVNGNVMTDVWGIASITAGTYNGKFIKNSGTSLEVVNGKFAQDPSDFLNVGYEAVLGSDNYYTIEKENITADIFEKDNDGNRLIKTKDDFIKFRMLINVAPNQSGTTFVLANDIDLENYVMGVAGNNTNRFSGNFDGRNYTIENVVIEGGDNGYTALFGNITGATIENLTVKNIKVKGGSYTAGLVGFTRNSTIKNCKIIGDINIEGTTHVGGIHAGGVVNELSDCTVSGNAGSSISGEWDVGAISALVSQGSGNVTGNTVEGIAIESEMGYAGGLIGRNLGSSGADTEVSNNSVKNVTVTSETADYSTGILVGSTNNNVSYMDNAVENSTAAADNSAISSYYGGELPSSVKVSYPISEKITVKLEMVKDNPNKYDVILVADENRDIHRFLSAELNITLTPDAADVTPISIKNIVGNEEYNIEVIKPEYNTSTIWGFHLGEVTDTTVKDFTGSELTIATIELAGYGTGELTVAAHANNKVQAIQSKDNNDVKFYTVDANTLVLPTGADYVNLEVPTKDLTIEITFVNPIMDQIADYQDMTVTVEGKDIDTKTLELGVSGDVQLVTSADGKVVQYVITLDDALTENNSYNITVTGAGYRTAEYRVTMTEDKTVYFWNDAVKGEAIPFEKDGVLKAKTSFLAGDIAEDNIIDKYDLAAVVSYFGRYGLTSSEDTYKYAKYDLNRDGKIDSEDIAYVLASFGY